MFFLEYIRKDMRPIEYELAKKFYIDKQEYKQTCKDLGIGKSWYYELRGRISKKIKEDLKSGKQM